MSFSHGVKPWDTESTEKIADCRIFTVEKVRRRNPQSGDVGEFYSIASRDWVNVVAVTVEQQLVLVRQFRHGTEEITLEIPGGIVDPGETPVDAARRELLEETGYSPRQMVEIGRVRSNPAIIDNWTYTALAVDCVASAEMSLDDHEEIEIELQPVSAIDQLVASGAITHALVIDALNWYRLYMRSTGNEPTGSGT
jgi:8-oxo-dGTP pyrophosphatase MutT (NUDIX family)